MANINKFNINDKEDIEQQYELYKLEVAQTIYIDGTKITDINKIEELAKLRMISWKRNNEFKRRK